MMCSDLGFEGRTGGIDVNKVEMIETLMLGAFLNLGFYLFLRNQ